MTSRDVGKMVVLMLSVLGPSPDDFFDEYGPKDEDGEEPFDVPVLPLPSVSIHEPAD